MKRPQRNGREHHQEIDAVLVPDAPPSPLAKVFVGTDVQVLHELVDRAEVGCNGPVHAVLRGRHRQEERHDFPQLGGGQGRDGGDRPIGIEFRRAAAREGRIVTGFDYAKRQGLSHHLLEVFQKAGANDARVGLSVQDLVHYVLHGLFRGGADEVNLPEEAVGVVVSADQFAHGHLKAREVVGGRGRETVAPQLRNGLDGRIVPHEKDRSLTPLRILVPL